MRTIQLVDPGNNTAPLNITRRVRNLQIAENACAFELPTAAQEASTFIDNLTYRWVVVARDGIPQRYRLHTPTMLRDGVRFDAIALIATLDDDQYSAFWSSAIPNDWEVLNSNSHPTRYNDQLWSLDVQGRIYIALENNATFPTNVIGGIGFRVPAGSSRLGSVIQFDIEFVAIPANFVWQLMRGTLTAGGLTQETFLLSPGTSTRSFCISLGATAPVLTFELYNSGAGVLFIGDTGSAYVRITNVRVATATTNLVATTVALAIAIGSVVITPAAMTNIYVGQRLIINSGAADSESVVVTAMTTTTFTATFVKAHLAGATVRAIVIYDDEIVKDVLSQALTLNPTGGLLAGTGYIQSSGIDRLQANWVDGRGSAVLDDLAKPVSYHFGVRENRLFYEGSNAYLRAWKVRVTDLQIVRPLDELYNSVRAAYTSDASGPQRTSYSTDEASTIINGITRRQTVDAQTNSATQAATVQATALADTKTRVVRSAMKILRVTDFYGAPATPDDISVGDSITIIGLPAVLAGNDKLRTFTVGERSIDPTTGDVAIVPEKPIKQLDVLLAQLAIG